MSDVARRAGVSKHAVSLALRHDPQIPEKTRRRIARIAQAMGYKKNPTVTHLMAQLRKLRTPAFQASLALLNANQDVAAFTQHPTIPIYVSGCRRRAEDLGYSLDEFWLHDPELNGERLNKILRARNIRGAIVVGLMKENRLPERFAPTWESIPTVVTGVRTREPALSFACTDHHMLALKAFQKAIELGYRRPALVLDHVIDELTDGRFSAGVQIAQAVIPSARRTRPFYFVEEARAQPALFHQWFEKEKPDALLTLYNVVKTWLKNRTDVGLIQLEWRTRSSDWAGMNQHNDVVGEAAIDMVISMIHHGAQGVPCFPRGTLVGSTWMNGSSVNAH
jgi:DNA-binding LacI/PurR family transcriptional regulator